MFSCIGGGKVQEKNYGVPTEKYLDLLKETEMSGCKLSDTPMEVNAKLSDIKDDVPVNTRRYQILVERLIYLSHSRPDIVFAVGMVSQFMHSNI